MKRNFPTAQNLAPPQAWYDRDLRRKIYFTVILTELDSQGKQSYIYVTDNGERYSGERLHSVIPDTPSRLRR